MGTHFEPESRDQVEDHWRAEREARCVDEIQTDAAGRNVHPRTQPGANTKGLLLDEIAKFVDFLIHCLFALKSGLLSQCNTNLTPKGLFIETVGSFD